MSETRPRLSIGGTVSGRVVVGDHNVVGDNNMVISAGYGSPAALARPGELPTDRVCEVYIPDRADPGPGSRLRCGSGLLVAERLVLTVAGVLGDVATTGQVRFPAADGEADGEVDGGGYRRCEVVWSRRDEAVDAALLRISDPDWLPPAGLAPLRWGRLVSAQPGVPGQVAGCADAGVTGSDPAGVWAYPCGTVNTLKPRVSRRVDLIVDCAPRPPRGGSPWRGICGAGLFVNGLLVGVVQQPDEYAGRRLTAVEVQRFATDPTFAALVWGGHRGGWPMLEPAELSDLQHQPLDTDSSAWLYSPGWLLRAEEEVVPFHGREETLARLLEWCDEPRQRSVRLLTGPGGQGKTRLARELGRRAAHAGWAVLTLADCVPDAAYWQLRAVNVPLLVLVDYPEQRGDQLDRLVAKLPRKSPVRLLLLARTNGAWLPELQTRSRHFAALLAAARSPTQPNAIAEEPLDPRPRS